MMMTMMKREHAESISTTMTKRRGSVWATELTVAGATAIASTVHWTVWRCVTHRVRKGRVEGGRGEGQGEGGGRREGGKGWGDREGEWSKLKSKCVQMLFSILYMYIGNYCLLHVYIHVYIHVYTIICM